jgi:Ca2+-binding RTX toxin-like protein
MRIAIPLAVAATVLGTLAPAAHAASAAGLVGNVLTITGDSGPNTVTISRVSPNVFVVTDTSGIVGSDGCVPMTLDTVLCTDPNFPITGITVRTSAGDDVVTFAAGHYLGVDLGATWPVRTVEAGAGDDQVTGADTTYGGDGNDTVQTASDPAGVRYASGGEGNDTLTATGPARLDGDGGDDMLYGSEGADDLRGGTGADGAVGYGGDDTIDGGDGDDQLYGAGGQDTLTGGAGGDHIEGGLQENVIRAGDGRDFVAVRNGYPDDVDCGADDDWALTDAWPGEAVVSYCDTVIPG